MSGKLFYVTVNFKKDALSGLQAQISNLNNFSFGHLLSPPLASQSNQENMISLKSVYETGSVAYFQLNTLAFGDSSRRLGRMILEDLKALSGLLHNQAQDGGNPVMEGMGRTPRPLHVYIDEFGAFAGSEFVEFLKQSRS